MAKTHTISIRVAVCLAFAFALWFGFYVAGRHEPAVQQTLREIRLATARNPGDGLQRARTALAAHPLNARIASAAADAATAADDLQELLSIVLGNYSGQLSVGDSSIQALIDSGNHRPAESLLNQRLELSPDDQRALHLRADLMLRQGRRSRVEYDLGRLLSLHAIPLDDLIFLSSRRELLEDDSGLNRAIGIDPDYAPSYLGLGSLAAFQGDLHEAERNLQKAVSLDQELDDAWSALGVVYFRQGDSEGKLSQWRNDVQKSSFHQPDTLYVLAWMAEQDGKLKDATVLLCDALTETPLHRPSCQLLSAILARQSGHELAAQFFFTRAGLIHELELHLHEVLLGPRTSSDFSKAADLCSQLGASELAVAWASGSKSNQGHSDNRRSLLAKSNDIDERFRGFLESGQLNQFGVANAAITSEAGGASGRSAISSTSATRILLTDIAADVGLASTFFGGFKNFESGLWVYQGFGGGVGVLDIDHDDQPDLYFAQASNWPADSSLPPDRQDLLYRSGNGKLERVNGVAMKDEKRFGQGVAIGDVNRDGFDDIYIANIGVNRLLLNNGDGTFQAVDMPSNTSNGPDWTTSCLLADLDNDGLDDIYDVRYLSGPEPFNKVCRSGAEQLVRSCLPSLFDAASDRVMRNSGDGTFDDQTSESGLATFEGRGLGIVAADLDGQAGIEIFVGNDMSANHYFKIDISDGKLSFREQAELHGLARNGEGQSEACMGIAAADFSGDGSTDLFVTNFFQETNTFYESVPGDFFRDQTAVAQLGAVSQKQLGFGAQAMDIDLDGDADLLIANGHVDNYSHMGAPWKMKFDIMENLGGGVFRRRADSDSGVYGETAALGRAVAKLDWNRDGLPDAAVTHLDRGPALLQNETSPSGSFVSLNLIGIKSNRPAIGSKVVVRSGRLELVVQQIAGDGYYCSNERTLMIGVGDVTTIREVEIHWPSGAVDRFSDVTAGVRYVSVEGRQHLYALTQ